ncbi:Cyclic nucleotide-binding protein [Syntrophobacter sp. SbD1]|nr:Cyclic nucleotide-binding protein [Syntrophobacter sp. SbD1]
MIPIDIRKDPSQALEVVVFQRGEVILSEGQECPFFLVILSGQVMLSKNGKEIRALFEQDIFALDSLLLKEPCQYSAKAAQECRVAKYGSGTLDHLIRESPRMVQSLLVSVLGQLNRTTTNLLDNPQPLLADMERINFYKDGEVIMEEVNRGTDLFRLISTEGGLQVTRGGSDVARIVKPGEFFGCPISLDPACVKSIGESVVERYGADDLDSLVRDYPESAGRMMQTMIERLSSR